MIKVKDRLVAMLMSLVILLSFSLTGCGGTAGNKPGSDLPPVVKEDEKPEEKIEEFFLSPEKTDVTTEDKLKISLGDFILDEETSLRVTSLVEEENLEEGYKVQAYDIQLGDMDQLDDFIKISIPYDDSYCEAGQDLCLCVGAKYLNDKTGLWEDILYELDQEAGEVHIYTDHLSTFGIFILKDEGRRTAKVSYALGLLSAVDPGEAGEVLQEYLAGGGAEGEKAQGLGARIVLDIFDFSGSLGDGLGYIENPISIASLGNPVFDSALTSAANDKLGQLGKIASAVRIGATVLKSDASDEDMLNLYKDVAFFALSFSKSAALGLAMSGVWIFDYTISSMFEEGMAMKMEKMAKAYEHYNDSYSGGKHRARTLKEWRQILIDIVEANPSDEGAVKEALEAEIDDYARKFWSLPLDTVYEVVAHAGLKDMPYPTNDEIETMVKDYKLNLYERLYPVSKSVSNYMQNKAHAEYVKALNELKDFYNQPLEFKIVEQLAEDDQVRSSGFIASFEPLSQEAYTKDWYGPIDKDGQLYTYFTILGFIQAGMPDTLAIYDPGSKPGEDKPLLEEKFVLRDPLTLVEFILPEDELVYTSSKEYDGIVESGINRAFEQIGRIKINPDGSFSEQLPFFQKEGYLELQDGSMHAPIYTLTDFKISGNFDPVKGTGSAHGSFKIVGVVDVDGGNKLSYQDGYGENKWEIVHSYHIEDLASGSFKVSKEGNLIKMTARFNSDNTETIRTSYNPVKVEFGQSHIEPEVYVYEENYDVEEVYYFSWR